VYASAQAACRDTEYEPECGKGDTYLPEKIEGHIRVIPDVPVHNNIVEYPYGKLYGGYHDRTDYTAAYERHSAAAVYCIEYRKYGAARQRHCPVSIAAHDYFYKTVAEIAHKK
jgi:hypothetical protein